MTPELVCDKCFETSKNYAAWNLSTLADYSSVDWIPEPKCPSCNSLYEIQLIHPSPTATHLACFKCGTNIPLRKSLLKSEPAAKSTAAQLTTHSIPRWQFWRLFSTERAVSKQLRDLESAKGYGPVAEEKRRTIAEALGGLGPAAVAALPSLVRLLGDSEKTIRTAAEKALSSIDPNWLQNTAIDVSIPALTETLTGYSDSGEQHAVTKVLRQLGIRAAASVPALIRWFANDGNRSPNIAEEALDAIDPKWRRSEAANAVAASLVKRLHSLMQRSEQLRTTSSQAQAEGQMVVVGIDRQKARDELVSPVQSLFKGLARLGSIASFAAPVVMAVANEFNWDYPDSEPDKVLDAVYPDWNSLFDRGVQFECTNSRCIGKFRVGFVFAGITEGICWRCHSVTRRKLY